MTNKYQGNHHPCNNGYNNKSSSYPNVQLKPQACSTRTSLSNLCPPTPASATVSIQQSNSVSPLISNSPNSISNPVSISVAQVRFNDNLQTQIMRITPESECKDDASVKSVDIESSLENLCLQMMEHALGP